MRTEDLGPFTELLETTARAMRAKLTSADVKSYWDALSDMPFAAVREKVLELRDSQRWFPRVSQIRGAKEEDTSGAPTGPEKYSPDWWRGVHEVEAKEAHRERVYAASHLLLDRDLPPDLRAAEREVMRAARGESLYAGTPEGAEWAKRYHRATALRDRIKCLHEIARLEAEPVPENPNTADARRAWIGFLQSQVEDRERYLREFYPDANYVTVRDDWQ